MTREEELHLFSLIKDDDRQALERLFKAYYNTLCNFAVNFVHDFDLAQELVADVFYNLWKERKALNIHSNMKAYLFKCVKNKCFSHPELSLKYWESFEQNDRTHDPILEQTPETLYLYKELDTKYQEAYELLPPQCKLIFKLHKIDGLKYYEISETLSLSVKTIETQMSKALKLIRKSIMGYHSEIK